MTIRVSMVAMDEANQVVFVHDVVSHVLEDHVVMYSLEGKHLDCSDVNHEDRE
jgi:hypothetical protein